MKKKDYKTKIFQIRADFLLLLLINFNLKLLLFKVQISSVI